MGKVQFGCVIGTCLLKCQFLGPISHKLIKSVNGDNLFLSLMQSCETYPSNPFFFRKTICVTGKFECIHTVTVDRNIKS